MRNINQIVVHCAATRGDVSASTIDRWHRDRGWSGIGYHYVIRTDGTVERGRPLNKAGAHARGHNSDTVGICLAGGVNRHNEPSANFSESQMQSLRELLRGFELIHGITDICGHRDFPGVRKACPSFDVQHWLATNEVRG